MSKIIAAVDRNAWKSVRIPPPTLSPDEARRKLHEGIRVSSMAELLGLLKVAGETKPVLIAEYPRGDQKIGRLIPKLERKLQPHQQSGPKGRRIPVPQQLGAFQKLALEYSFLGSLKQSYFSFPVLVRLASAEDLRSNQRFLQDLDAYRQEREEVNRAISRSALHLPHYS